MFLAFVERLDAADPAPPVVVEALGQQGRAAELRGQPPHRRTAALTPDDQSEVVLVEVDVDVGLGQRVALEQALDRLEAMVLAAGGSPLDPALVALGHVAADQVGVLEEVLRAVPQQLPLQAFLLDRRLDQLEPRPPEGHLREAVAGLQRVEVADPRGQHDHRRVDVGQPARQHTVAERRPLGPQRAADALLDLQPDRVRIGDPAGHPPPHRLQSLGGQEIQPRLQLDHEALELQSTGLGVEALSALEDTIHVSLSLSLDACREAGDFPGRERAPRWGPLFRCGAPSLHAFPRVPRTIRSLMLHLRLRAG